MTISVCYCYYKPFHTLPNRRWKNFNNKEAAKEFVDNLESKHRFLWCIMVDGKEVNEKWIEI